MAVNSKADKTHGLKSTGEKKAAYAALPAPPTGVMGGPIAPAAPKNAPVLGPAGTKSLLLRAKKELTSVSDPTQPIAD